MPSKTSIELALRATAAERKVFRAAVSATLEQVRGMLVQTTAQSGAERARDQLGWFAEGRIDTGRFAALFHSRKAMPRDDVVQVRHAQHVLSALLALSDDAHSLHVAAGRDLRDVVRQALAVLGRVFAAAHLIAAVRDARAPAENGEVLLAQRGPECWTRAERALAPPLVIEVDGGDLLVGGFEDYLQGAQKIVLLVNGPAPPAPLVRLVSPGRLVLQTTDANELATLEGFAGPAIAALLPEGAARFLWRPALDGRSELRVDFMPGTDACARIGRISGFQQTEDLLWLRRIARDFALASERAPMPAETASVAALPAEQLAAWLLRESNVSEVVS